MKRSSAIWLWLGAAVLDAGCSTTEKPAARTAAVPPAEAQIPAAAPTTPPAVATPAIDPRKPGLRPPMVTQRQARPAILSENTPGTANLGPTAVDPKWSNYGAYLQRVIDTVQRQWERIILEHRTKAAIGSQVSVKFIMDSEGRITKIVKVESTADEAGARACVGAITDRVPYGRWTDDMRVALGEQQEMTFTFYYQ